jgi:UDP-N-acetyl-D-mannosaminuronate dehydrogenase
LLNGSQMLEQKILDRSARIGIIGLGYVGLPEAVMFAQTGFFVTGFDVDPERVGKIDAGDSYIADVPSEEFRALPMLASSTLQSRGSDALKNASFSPQSMVFRVPSVGAGCPWRLRFRQ